MTAPAAALAQRAHQERLASQAGRATDRLWRQVDPNNIGESWTRLLPNATTLLATLQLTAALGSAEYLDELLGVAAPAVAAVNADAFSGVASDGRDLPTLLTLPAITTLGRIRQGDTPTRALAAGRWQLDTLVRTQVLDAGRAAEQVGTAARPRVVAYTRVVSSGACGRCVVLAGREYAWSEGFARHPRCACQTVPLRPGQHLTGTDPAEAFNAMSREQQNRSFGVHNAAAIRAGADIGQVVNARRGMIAPGDRRAGRRYTTEGTTRRGLAGQRLGDIARAPGQRYATSRRPRLTPEAIMRDSRDRQHALELLYEHGYLMDPPAPATRAATPATGDR
ncbi:hypothetical protein [Nocardiopsis synnemataformans]|uniref:VG15 protein n=1 Tax=Nocardiopsis synnemataformans TaxID=61305 RepID=UPI003EBAB9E0